MSSTSITQLFVFGWTNRNLSVFEHLPYLTGKTGTCFPSCTSANVPKKPSFGNTFLACVTSDFVHKTEKPLPSTAHGAKLSRSLGDRVQSRCVSPSAQAEVIQRHTISHRLRYKRFLIQLAKFILSSRLHYLRKKTLPIPQSLSESVPSMFPAFFKCRELPSRCPRENHSEAPIHHCEEAISADIWTVSPLQLDALWLALARAEF